MVCQVCGMWGVCSVCDDGPVGSKHVAVNITTSNVCVNYCLLFTNYTQTTRRV